LFPSLFTPLDGNGFGITKMFTVANSHHVILIFPSGWDDESNKKHHVFPIPESNNRPKRRDLAWNFGENRRIRFVSITFSFRLLHSYPFHIFKYSNNNKRRFSLWKHQGLGIFMRLLNLRIDHEGSSREEMTRFITWSFGGFIGFQKKIVEIFIKKGLTRYYLLWTFRSRQVSYAAF
jgi:hypothetical protein